MANRRRTAPRPASKAKATAPPPTPPAVEESNTEAIATAAPVTTNETAQEAQKAEGSAIFMLTPENEEQFRLTVQGIVSEMQGGRARSESPETIEPENDAFHGMIVWCLTKSSVAILAGACLRKNKDRVVETTARLWLPDGVEMGVYHTRPNPHGRNTWCFLHEMERKALPY